MRDHDEQSADALASLDELPLRRQAIIAVLSLVGPATDEQLAEHYEGLREGHPDFEWLPVQSPSGLRTRRREVADRGVVEHNGFDRTRSGRWAKRWQVVGGGYRQRWATGLTSEASS